MKYFLRDSGRVMPLERAPVIDEELLTDILSGRIIPNKIG